MYKQNGCSSAQKKKKNYLQKEAAAQIWSTGCILATPGLGDRIRIHNK